MSTKKKVEEIQPNLFGKMDEIYNTISLEITVIQDEIKGVVKSIESKEEKLEDLSGRLKKMQSALKDLGIVKKGSTPEEKKEDPKK